MDEDAYAEHTLENQPIETVNAVEKNKVVSAASPA